MAKILTAIRRDVPLSVLSRREGEVLQLMAYGLSDKGIAARLYVSLNTVGTHVQHIFQKLSVPDGYADNRRVLAVLVYLQAAGYAEPIATPPSRIL